MKEANERLRQLRKQKQYTQEDLAKKLGISIRAYSKIESGEAQLTLERLNEILDILDILRNRGICCEYCRFCIDRHEVSTVREAGKGFIKLLLLSGNKI